MRRIATLAAMAAWTTNSRVGCLVGSVTYHNPALLAKMAVTIDHISGGRAEFGLGAGWHEPEHLGYGIDFPAPGGPTIRRWWPPAAATSSARLPVSCPLMSRRSGNCS